MPETARQRADRISVRNAGESREPGHQNRGESVPGAAAETAPHRTGNQTENDQ